MSARNFCEESDRTEMKKIKMKNFSISTRKKAANLKYNSKHFLVNCSSRKRKNGFLRVHLELHRGRREMLVVSLLLVSLLVSTTDQFFLPPPPPKQWNAPIVRPPTPPVRVENARRRLFYLSPLWMSRRTRSARPGELFFSSSI